MRSFSIILVMVFASLAHGRGNESGGGGDEIRANFIKLGQDVIQFLATDPSGTALANFHQIDIETLEKTLSIDRIAVSDEILIDRTNSVVDAVVRDDKVVLNQSRWLVMLNSKDDVHYLVFHEMLRLSGVSDDNYLISKGLREAMNRRKALPSTTQSVSITCTAPANAPGQMVSQIIFGKSYNEAATFLFQLYPQKSSKSNKLNSLIGVSHKVTRMGTDAFTILAKAGQVNEIINLQYDLTRETATVNVAEKSSGSVVRILKCVATAKTLASSKLRAELPLAIEYVADGM